MEKEILSLRNIYRLLMVKDYPVYSTGVFKEDNRKGMTLTKFWQENLLYEFKSGYYGKMIWKSTGGRNRHLSEMCNRSEVLKWYPQYTEELVAGINERNMLLQIGQFMNCLRERQYDANVLERKILSALPMFEEQDEYCTKEITDFLLNSLVESQSEMAAEEEAMLFLHGWVLTFLSLHAMTGNQMSGIQLRKVREAGQFTPQALWKVYQKSQRREQEEVHFLTNQNNALCITPLPMMHFFGRERELFDLREILEQGGCYMLSGMGGIGKTELLRQLLQLCVEQKLVDEIAVIQYEGSLKSSCLNAFPNMRATDGDVAWKEALARIRMQQGKRVLTLVDNMNNTLEEDPELEQLLTLPGTVILTSRLTSLEGFTTYEVKAPSRETGTLIFRDNYGKALSSEDKEQLHRFLKQDVWCHTLTLRLLGNTAKAKGWSVSQLKKKLEEDGKQLFKSRENREISLTEMYRRMYDLSELSERQVRFLRCFATLPYQNYTEEFLREYMADYFVNVECIEQELLVLQELGWINIVKQGYSMHPVIAECILSEPATEADVKELLEKVERRWLQESGISGENILKEWHEHFLIHDITVDYDMHIFKSIFSKLTGVLSQRTVKLYIMYDSNDLHSHLIEGGRNISEAIALRCDELTSEMRLWLNILGLRRNYRDKRAYYQQLWENIEDTKTPRWLQQVYGIQLIWGMHREAELERAKDIAKKLLQEEMIPMLRIMLLHGYAALFFIEIRFEEAATIESEVVQLATKFMMRDSDLLVEFYHNVTCFCMAAGQKEEAWDYLKQMEVLVKERKTTQREILLHRTKAELARYEGDFESACEAGEKEIKLYFLTDGPSLEYGFRCCNLALLHSKCGRHERGEELYLEGLEILKASESMHREVARNYSNMSDMYILWGKPEKALECLEQSAKYGTNVPDVAIGERHRNFARAYRLLGDVEEEHKHLTICVPLLTEAYGPGHERTVAMRERLEEVEKLMK